MVIIPAVPPNSSTTQATLLRSFVNFVIKSLAPIVSGMTEMGNKISFKLVGFLYKSNW